MQLRKYLSLFLLLISVTIFAQKKWEVRFYNELKDGQYYVLVDNEEFTPISTQLTFTLKNLKSTLSNDEIVVIPPRTKRFLLTTLSTIIPNAGNSFSYKNTYNFGNVLQEDYEKDYVYSLPFETGKTHLIFQGYNGEFSHKNEFALDFNLKVGDPIFAAREGIVVEVQNTSNYNCFDISCAKYNNKIVIMHSDGTFADYSHLKYQGTVVKKGDVVAKNQLIGYSGNTGFSSGPHLHFAVFINRINGDRTFIKTKFKTSESEATLLEEGKSYTKNYK